LAATLTVLLLPLVALAAQANDWKIVPGERVGPITRASTLASLQQQFGAANVHEQAIPGAEGEESPGAIVYPDNPARRLAIVWGEGESVGHPEFVEICYRQEYRGPCEWKTAQGIALGTSLMQLERLNGHLFPLAGFGWHGSGVVFSWDGGRLEKLRSGGVGLSLIPGSFDGLHQGLQPSPGRPQFLVRPPGHEGTQSARLLYQLQARPIASNSYNEPFAETIAPTGDTARKIASNP